MRHRIATKSEGAMATLLLTATQDVSDSLAQKLEKVGYDSIILPLLEITDVKWEAPFSPPKNILITSRYGLKTANLFKGCPLYIVGHKTAELAREQGHTIAHIGFTIDSLFRHLPEDILYLRGRDVSQELPLPSIICYEATPTDYLNTIPPYDAAILLSARAAKHLPDIQNPIICLSQQVKDALSQHNQALATTAAEPTEYELIEAIKHWNTDS